MLNFTVGPVQSNEIVREIGSEQVPYFRTSEFSNIMLENEQYIKSFAHAEDDSKVVFLTGSGTAAMEAVVMNTLSDNDKVLVVNGGSFGARFVQLCRIHRIPFEEIVLKPGKNLTEEILSSYDGGDYTAFLVNIHETSTGVLYNAELISDFCKRNHMFLIVDAISSFLADDLNMKALGIDVMISSSQKALACPPGVSLIVLSEKALSRIESIDSKCMYFDLKDALNNAKRGQTPFTPAVGILLQIHARLKDIDKHGGPEYQIQMTHEIADDFRKRILHLPFEIVSESLSNAVTPLHPLTCSAYDIFLTLKDEYGIWICPNGGALKDTVFRVGHIGDLTIEDNTALIQALEDMKQKGKI